MSCDVGEATESLENEQSSCTGSSLTSPGEPPMFVIVNATLMYSIIQCIQRQAVPYRAAALQSPTVVPPSCDLHVNGRHVMGTGTLTTVINYTLGLPALQEILKLITFNAYSIYLRNKFWFTRKSSCSLIAFISLVILSFNSCNVCGFDAYTLFFNVLHK